MAVVSRPIAYGALTAAIAAVLVWTSGDAPASPNGPAHKKSLKTKDTGWDFPAPDPTLHFIKPRTASRNPFDPLVKKDQIQPLAQKPQEDLVQIPSGLADGEGGWAYTGWAAIDGAPMALLENSGTKQSGYVRVGETWKKAHIVAITFANIVLADDKGRAQTVNRFNPNDPPKSKPAPEAGFQPPIAGGIGLRPLTPPAPPTGRRVSTTIVGG